MTRARVRAVALLALAFAGIYLSAMLVGPLRRADDQAKQFSSVYRLNDRMRAQGLPVLKEVMFALVITAVLALAAVIVVLAWRRGRFDEELRRAAAIPLVALALAEAGKLVLPRPAQAFEPWWLAGRTFPSGHAATGAGCLLALHVLAHRPARFAPLLAAGMALYAIGVVLSGQHRPSDALGALVVALMAFWAVGPLVPDASRATPAKVPTAPDDNDAGFGLREFAVVTVIVGVVVAMVAAMSAPSSGALLQVENSDGSFALLAASLALLALSAAVGASVAAAGTRPARTTPARLVRPVPPE